MERMVSPGVFTRENDLSFLPQGIAEIGAGFVGPTQKGPAFRPIVVESQEDFRSLFGGTTPDYYLPYAVRNYMREANRATIVRILGLEGYDPDTTVSAVLTISGSDGIGNGGSGGEFPLAVLHPTARGGTINTINVSGTWDDFEIEVDTDLGDPQTFSGLSANRTDPNYFAKVIGSTPKTRNTVFVYLDFPRAFEYAGEATSEVDGAPTTTELDFGGEIFGRYANARTPMIRSQDFGNNSGRLNLFRFYTLSDGDASNDDVKVSIGSVRPDPSGGYGTFSVTVRRFRDTDGRMEVLEQFDGLNMDATSPSYIARRIGTARTVIDQNGASYLEGDYPNNSRYIYVEMADGAEDLPEEVLPYGHGPLISPVNLSNVPAPQYVTTRYTAPIGGGTPVPNNRLHYGFDFASVHNRSFVKAIPSGSRDAAWNPLQTGDDPDGATDDGFFIDADLTGDDASDVEDILAFSLRKFTVPFQGGFDGKNPAGLRATGEEIVEDNTQGFDLSDADADGARAYRKAIRILSDPDSLDINMLILPGVVHEHHSYVTNLAIEMCEDRGDCFYIMDPAGLGAGDQAVVNAVQGVDTNYAGVYHPWIKIRDQDNNKNIWVPPSVVMVGVFAFNDKISAEWYAPAGLNRGGITTALQVRSRLAKPSRDTLYEGRVNPIAQFPAQGITAWGQKTLQTRASALDRINVRRLLIAVKKFIASSSRYLVFEQNVESTRQRFLSIANPYLSSVQERNGLFAFRVIMDESNNPPEIIDRNVLIGEIYLQPARTAEFISLTFNVLPTGATFDED